MKCNYYADEKFRLKLLRFNCATSKYPDVRPNIYSPTGDYHYCNDIIATAFSVHQ